MRAMSVRRWLVCASMLVAAACDPPLGPGASERYVLELRANRAVTAHWTSEIIGRSADGGLVIASAHGVSTLTETPVQASLSGIFDVCPADPSSTTEVLGVKVTIAVQEGIVTAVILEHGKPVASGTVTGPGSLTDLSAGTTNTDNLATGQSPRVSFACTLDPPAGS